MNTNNHGILAIDVGSGTQEILDQMGHGCHVISGGKDVSTFNHLSITGPNRVRFSNLGGHMTAPHGDMMLTGCFGLIDAVMKRMNGKDE